MSGAAWAAIAVFFGLAAILIVTTILCACKLAARADHAAGRDDLLRYGDRLIRQLNAEAERLYPDTPPCSHEDGWCVCVPEPWDSRWAQ